MTTEITYILCGAVGALLGFISACEGAPRWMKIANPIAACAFAAFMTWHMEWPDPSAASCLLLGALLVLIASLIGFVDGFRFAKRKQATSSDSP